MIAPALETIGAKEVYVIESHENALYCWAEIRNKTGHPITLITLDHHTDTQVAFTHNISISNGFPNSLGELIDAANQRCASVDTTNAGTVLDACSQLLNSEHIDAAIRMGIISHAFVVSYESSIMYGPERKIFHISSQHGRAEGVAEREHFDQFIETTFLDKIDSALILEAEVGMVANLGQAPYILDIDLDYFHTRKSIDPGNLEAFFKLIRNATAITIATEPSYVLSEQLSGENLTSDYLLDRIRAHVANAVS